MSVFSMSRDSMFSDCKSTICFSNDQIFFICHPALHDKNLCINILCFRFYILYAFEQPCDSPFHTLYNGYFLFFTRF